MVRLYSKLSRTRQVDYEVLATSLQSPHPRVEEEIYPVWRAQKVSPLSLASVEQSACVCVSRMLYEMVGSKKTLLGSWPQNRGTII